MTTDALHTVSIIFLAIGNIFNAWHLYVIDREISRHIRDLRSIQRTRTRSDAHREQDR